MVLCIARIIYCVTNSKFSEFSWRIIASSFIELDLDKHITGFFSLMNTLEIQHWWLCQKSTNYLKSVIWYQTNKLAVIIPASNIFIEFTIEITHIEYLSDYYLEFLRIENSLMSISWWVGNQSWYCKIWYYWSIKKNKIMKFRVKVIEMGLKKDSILPAVRSYRPRRICVYHLLMLAWDLQICVSLGISKELRKQRIFKQWKMECTTVN